MAHGGPIPAPGHADSDFFRRMDAQTYRARMNGAEQKRDGKSDGVAIVMDGGKPRLKWSGNNNARFAPETVVHTNAPPSDWENQSDSPPPGWDDEKNADLNRDDGQETSENEKENGLLNNNSADENRNNNKNDDKKKENSGEDGQEKIAAVTDRKAPWRMIGEAFRTYLICECDDDIWLIDKHAAHERINFDKLREARENPMRQTLLVSQAVELAREDALIVLENLDILDQMGFACEDFGDGSILIREIPDGMDPEEVTAALEELAEDFKTGRSVEERRDAALKTVACKMSIKGGWENDERELYILMEKVRSGEIRYCPHGRPVAVKITKRELEKKFKRII